LQDYVVPKRGRGASNPLAQPVNVKVPQLIGLSHQLDSDFLKGKRGLRMRAVSRERDAALSLHPKEFDNAFHLALSVNLSQWGKARQLGTHADAVVTAPRPPATPNGTVRY
jgi:hypothetical protein